MPKSSAPTQAPTGEKWCSRHRGGKGDFLDISLFPNEKYSYCRECKREYQRVWDKENRIREPRIVLPAAKLSKDERGIIIHLPNTEKGRNVTREALAHWPDIELNW